ncbi:MAG: hypothetical protein COA94_03115 [Rickettsiales bacterium]|nr:MAG: hypothetical protein COA94_03115 [Rickettsiales bacterium]
MAVSQMTIYNIANAAVAEFQTMVGNIIPEGLKHKCMKFPDCNIDVYAPTLFCNDHAATMYLGQTTCNIPGCKNKPLVGFPVCEESRHMRFLTVRLMAKQVKIIREYLKTAEENEDTCAMTQEQAAVIESLKNELTKKDEHIDALTLEKSGAEANLLFQNAETIKQVKSLEDDLSNAERRVFLRHLKYTDDIGSIVDEHKKDIAKKNVEIENFKNMAKNNNTEEIDDLKESLEYFKMRESELSIKCTHLATEKKKMTGAYNDATGVNQAIYGRIRDFQTEDNLKTATINAQNEKISTLKRKFAQDFSNLERKFAQDFSNLEKVQEMALNKMASNDVELHRENDKIKTVNDAMETDLNCFKAECETLRSTTDAISEERDALFEECENYRIIMASMKTVFQGFARPATIERPKKRTRVIVEDDSDDEIVSELVIDETV